MSVIYVCCQYLSCFLWFGIYVYLSYTVSHSLSLSSCRYWKIGRIGGRQRRNNHTKDLKAGFIFSRLCTDTYTHTYIIQTPALFSVEISLLLKCLVAPSRPFSIISSDMLWLVLISGTNATHTYSLSVSLRWLVIVDIALACRAPADWYAKTYCC